MPEIPFSITLIFLAVTLFLIVFIAAFVNRASHGTTGAAPPNRKVVVVSVGTLLAWLAVTGVLAANGFFRDFSSVPPRFAVALVPALIAVILLASLPRVRAFVRNAPVSALIFVQSFRVLLELMLYGLHGAGVIPERMTFEGLNFDIVTGLTAPFVGWLVSRGTPAGVRVAQVWNVLGLLLALAITVISVLSAPTQFRVFTEGPANTFVAEFPFIWLPAFVVPAALLFHLWSLAQLSGRANGET